MPATQKSKSNLFIKALIGAGIMLLVTAISVILVGAVISMHDDPLSAIGIGSIATVIISSSVSAVIISRTNAEGGLFLSMLSGLLFIGIALLVGLFISGGKMGGGVILNMLIYLALSLVVSFLLSGKKKRRGYRR